MKISIAKTAGFCMGVRRAVEMVLAAPSKCRHPIYTYGPLIHNPQVLSILEEKGISIMRDIPDHGTGTVLIRAHGIPPNEKNMLETAGFNVIDATCPRVIKVQSIIVSHAKKGYTTIIIGDREHPEVKGLLGYAGESGVVVDNIGDLKTLPPFEKAIVVAQTTQNMTFFEEVTLYINNRYPSYKVFNTICDSTVRRQEEVGRLAQSTDAIIVVGGKDSGNTQRLAQIARQFGKQSYHVESESELDFDRLKSADKIGITAGASTPNWVLKKVSSRLETFKMKANQGWSSLFFSIQRHLLLTNIWVALGAGCLGYACTTLQGITYHSPHALIAILYVQSMHMLNHLIGSKSDRFNDPDRAAFYDRNKVFLVLLAVVTGAAGLLTAFSLGIYPFLTLLIMSLMGLSYNIRLIPGWFPISRYRRIRDIPGSKTVLIAAAWGIVTTILPLLSAEQQLGKDTIIVFLWSAGMVFVRTAFFEILDIQGDRIVGKETIPILLGEKRTMILLKGLLIFSFGILVFSSLIHIIPNLGFMLAVCPALMAAVLIGHEKNHEVPFIRLEFLIESHFLFAGILTFFWYLI